MILLESEKEMNNQRKDGTVVSKIYCMGEYLGQTTTQLMFKEVYYFIKETEVDNPISGGSPTTIIKEMIELPETNYKSTMKLRMKDYGSNPTPEQTAENQNTVEFLFQTFGVDINKQTGYADGIDANFEHIFKMVQNQRKYYDVEKWNVKSQS
ncbi:MAG: Unknown protein [uncultured Sulfurovum sp.]|uniref:Uncharacterized protein n=1 Tax=uncultured Sulfurovum sp. TaxID=269237 RepID=A0A6S6T0R9_9BACT|nr:MAG: Unknown protein [uncultured Sulfurovum sp.]